MTPEILARINQARAAKQQTALIRNIHSGEPALLIDGEITHGEASSEAIDFAKSCLTRDQSRKTQLEEGDVFVQIFNPPLRLFIIGAVHISQALAPMAALAEYDVCVIDPRGAFATQERFPGVALDDEWPDEALEAHALDRRSAVVALTHDPKIDDPALEQALKSEAFYIAALGSRRTHGQRRSRLEDVGFDERTIDRIHGPAGLDIGAISPAEIAVSVMAEMTSALRRSSSTHP